MIGDPCVPVECDKCGDVDYFSMTSLAQKSWDNRNLDGALKRARWRKNGDETFCPECVAEIEEASTRDR